MQCGVLVFSINSRLFLFKRNYRLMAFNFWHLVKVNSYEGIFSIQINKEKKQY